MAQLKLHILFILALAVQFSAQHDTGKYVVYDDYLPDEIDVPKYHAGSASIIKPQFKSSELQAMSKQQMQ